MTTGYQDEITVSFGDCDPARVVYTARLPWFALDAINGWWVHHIGSGWYQMEIDQDIGTPFVHMSMNLRKPVTPRHKLICSVWPNRLGTTSVGFHVEGRQRENLCFEGDFVSVFTVASKYEKAPPHETLRSIIKTHLIECSL